MQVTTRWLKIISERLEKAWSAQAIPLKMFEEKELIQPIIEHKISICTTCMGRLMDLEKTFPKNIEDNIGYKNVEFVLLDYNSNDNLESWAKDTLKDLIKSKKVVYVKTEEPQFYTMAHSRNVAFKIASGDIVTNVDADNFTGPGFATRLNLLSNQAVRTGVLKNVFVKSFRSTHGRIGFWRKEFIDVLGGYDEMFIGYGHDDRDIIYRAMQLGFTIVRFGGEESSRLKSKVNKVANYDPDGIDKNWRYTEQLNKIISYSNLMVGNLVANVGKEWGKAKLIKNFTDEVIL
jgi:hypothetical protein